ncbi:MAG TPA: hybrid sensor histidine kinase/response regulator, partial [Roseateles sp.]
LFALAARRWQARFQAQRQAGDAAAVLARWQPRVEALGLAHGLALTVGVLLTAGRASYEIQLLLHLVLAAVTAANASRQNASLSVFWRFFGAGWLACVALTPWAFPQHWPYLLPLSLLFALSVMRDALDAHRFFVDHLRLEVRSQRLIERLEQAQQQAQWALQEKNRFLSTASHDLRQPLHAMSLLTEALSQRNRDAALQPLIGELKHGMASMSQMFTSLLDLTRMESGALQPQHAWVDLHALVEDVAALFRSQAALRGIALRTHRPPAAAWVRADPVLLRQALNNLVHNAVRYTERGGVLLALRRRQGGWRVLVLDTGAGIAEADAAHVFSPYFRSQHAWRVDNAGHGLGLAVVQRCAALLQAQVGLRSQLGRGSVFWLQLPPSDIAARPALDDRGPALLDATDTQPAMQPLAGRCLVLDDDPQVLFAWRALFAGWGIDGRYASHAAEALALLDAGFVPDAILCDQRLRSGENGVDILKALLERFPAASGAMVSGEFDSPELRQAEEDGLLVLRKPLAPEDLHGLLAAWLPVGGGVGSVGTEG